MIAVANRIFVSPAHAEAFEARFAARAGLVDKMPGFLHNLVLKPTQEGDPYVVMTYWESLESFRAWTGSDSFKQGHARSGSLPKEAFTGPNKLEIHEVIMDSRHPKPAAEAPSEGEPDPAPDSPPKSRH